MGEISMYNGHQESGIYVLANEHKSHYWGELFIYAVISYLFYEFAADYFNNNIDDNYCYWNKDFIEICVTFV